jgi:hypothetical protein
MRMIKTYVVVTALGLAVAAGAFAGQVETGSKGQPVKLPFCGT